MSGIYFNGSVVGECIYRNGQMISGEDQYNYANECNFIKNFVNTLHSIDNRIVCPTNIDRIFEIDSANKYPYFSLIIDNRYTIDFKRKSKINDNDIADGYELFSEFWSGSRQLLFADSAYPFDGKAKKEWKFCIAANNKVLTLNLGNYNASKLPFSFVSFSESSVGGYAGIYSANSSASAISQNFRLDDNIIAQKVDRIPYAYNTSDSTNVEYIADKSFIINNSQTRRFSTDGLCDISTITPNILIDLDNKTYYSLDSHTLIPVS